MDTIRICSFTGGGSRAVIQAVIAAEIEKRIKRHLLEVFHISVASSSGALNLLPLALLKNGKPLKSAEELLSEWPESSEKILKIDYIRALRSGKGRRFPAFDSAGRLEAIDTVLGDYRLSDVKSDIVIMSHNVENGRPYPFSSTFARGDFSERTPANYTEKDPAFYDFYLTDVAMATTALPGAFEAHTMTNMQGDAYKLADGGISNNNPFNLSVQLAHNLHGRDIDITGVIFGTGYIPVPQLNSQGLNEWTRRITDHYPEHAAGSVITEATLNPFVTKFFNLDMLFERKATHLPALKYSQVDGSAESIRAIIENTRYAIEHDEKLRYKIDELCEILQEPMKVPCKLEKQSDAPASEKNSWSLGKMCKQIFKGERSVKAGSPNTAPTTATSDLSL